MAMAQEDRRFLIGLGVAAAVLALYAVAVRGPLRAAIADRDRELRADRAKLDLYFRNPKATPFSQVERELTQRLADLDQRLGDIRASVEFDPGPLDPTGGAGGAATDLADLYFKLSSALHDKAKAAAERAPHLVRVPAVFDPQGRIQTPQDPALVDRYHRQLVTAYQIVMAAVAHRVDIVELRAAPPQIEAVTGPQYLGELAVTVKAQASLDALAAFLHALSQPPQGKGGSKFLSVAHFAIGASDDHREKVQYEITVVSARANPDVDLAAAPAKKEPPTTGGRRRPRTAPLY